MEHAAYREQHDALMDELRAMGLEVEYLPLEESRALDEMGAAWWPELLLFLRVVVAIGSRVVDQELDAIAERIRRNQEDAPRCRRWDR